MNYYNEWDKGAAAWLRELIKAGLIPNGYVDERSITEVKPADLAGFTQCHFFCGIGGWPLALQLAGVPATQPLWTGSPPCQPFSVAGKQLAQDDPRHLAPSFLELIAQCRPQLLFGEQVAAAIGKHWLDALLIELEEQDYTCGAAVLPACSVGAPHKRDRLFFGASLVVHADNQPIPATGHGAGAAIAGRTGAALSQLADSDDDRQQSGAGRSGSGQSPSARDNTGRSESASSVEQSGGQRRERGQTPASGHEYDGTAPIRAQGEHGSGESGAYRVPENSASQNQGFWSDADWLGCRDGKFRPVESGTFPLAHGIPARVGRLRGYGNAIVPQVAAEFIKAFAGAAAE